MIDYLGSYAGQLSADSKTRLATNPLRILDSKDSGDREILKEAPKLDDHLNAVSKAHFARLTKALDASSIRWIYDPLLVRGLDYYCHTAFEFVTNELGTQGTVLGGGRYDGLSEMLGGPKVPGVGWAAGVERLAMLVDNSVVPAFPQVAILAADSESEQAAFQLAEQLRDADVDIDLPTSGTIGKKLKKADKNGIRLALILGSDERARNMVKLRSLVSGEQREISLGAGVGELVNTIAENLLAP